MIILAALARSHVGNAYEDYYAPTAIEVLVFLNDDPVRLKRAIHYLD